MDTALQSAEAAREIDPDSTLAGLLLSGDHLQQGNTGEASDVIDQLLESDDSSLILNVAKLQMLARLEQTSAIGPHIKRMVELFPTETQFRHAICRAAYASLR